MKNMDTKERFIELRARGFSFDNIADKLGVSKPTLIKWHKEFEREIVNLRYIHVEGLLEKHGLLKQKKIEVLAEVLQRTLDEIKTRDLSDVPIKHLIEITKLVESRLEKEVEHIVYLTEDYNDPVKDLIEKSMTRLIRLGE